MRTLISTCIIAICTCFSFLSAQQADQPQRVIRSYHLGPWAPSSSADDANRQNNRQQAREDQREVADNSRDTAVVNGDGTKFFNPPPCQYCIQCNYKHWCPYCGYCPIYDESDIRDEYDRQATWPAKKTDSWMRENISF